MDGGALVEIRVIPGLDDTPAREWDACAAPECPDGGRPLYPFLTHRQIPGVAICRTAVVEPHHNALLLLNREMQPGAIARDNIVIT